MEEKVLAGCVLLCGAMMPSDVKEIEEAGQDKNFGQAEMRVGEARACPQVPRTKSSTSFYSVLAATERGGIGLKNKLPWRIPGELDLFREVTTRWANGNKPGVVMGRKTWQSLPCKPLPDRTNIVMSRNVMVARALNLPLNVYAVSSKQELVELCRKLRIGACYVIGGAELYAEMADLVEAYWLTVVGKIDKSEILADTFVNLPALLKGTSPTARTPEYTHLDFWYQQIQYTHTSKRPKLPSCSLLAASKPSWEYKYLELLHDISTIGSERLTDHKALFGRHLEIDISNSMVCLPTTWPHDVKQLIQDVFEFVSMNSQVFELVQRLLNTKQTQVPDDHIVLSSISAHFVVDHQDLWCLASQESVDAFSDLGQVIASLAVATHIISQACQLNAKTLVLRIGVCTLCTSDAPKVQIMLHRTPMPACHLDRVFPSGCTTQDEFVHACKSLDISDYLCHELPCVL